MGVKFPIAFSSSDYIEHLKGQIVLWTRIGSTGSFNLFAKDEKYDNYGITQNLSLIALGGLVAQTSVPIIEASN